MFIEWRFPTPIKLVVVVLPINPVLTLVLLAMKGIPTSEWLLPVMGDPNSPEPLRQLHSRVVPPLPCLSTPLRLLTLPPTYLSISPTTQTEQ